MDRAGHKLFAGTGFTINKHGAGAGGNGRQDFKDFLHQHAAADEIPQYKAAFQFAAQCIHFAQIPKGLCAANHFAAVVLENSRGNTDGQAGAVGTDNVPRFSNNGLTGSAGLAQGALGLAHAGSKNFGASQTDGLPAGNTGNLFRRPIERSDAPVQVHREHTVGNALKDRLGKFR